MIIWLTWIKKTFQFNGRLNYKALFMCFLIYLWKNMKINNDLDAIMIRSCNYIFLWSFYELARWTKFLLTVIYYIGSIDESKTPFIELLLSKTFIKPFASQSTPALKTLLVSRQNGIDRLKGAINLTPPWKPSLHHGNMVHSGLREPLSLTTHPENHPYITATWYIGV